MEIIYRADDGTEFESEKECRDHELKTADFYEECVNVRAYDDNGAIINFRDYDMEDMESAFQDISYIQFGTQKAIDLFLDKGVGEFGLLDIESDLKRLVEVGERYFYDWEEDEWRCLEDKYKDLDKIAAVFEDK